MYNPYQNTGYYQQQQQQQQQQPFGQQSPQVSGFSGMQGNLSSTPMNFSQMQSQQQPPRFGGPSIAVNPTGMNNLMPQPQNNFGSQQNTGIMGIPGLSNNTSATSTRGGFASQPQQQQPQSTGYFQPNTLPLQQPQLLNQPTGFQNSPLSNPTGAMQPLLPQSTGFYHSTGGMSQAPLEPLKPTATGLVNSFANGGLNHDIKIPARRLSFITSNDQAKFETLFRSIVPKGSNTISGEDCKKVFMKSGLQASELAKIWKLCDTSRAGQLLFPEFALAMHLVNNVLQGDSIPYELDTKTKNEVGSFVDAINMSIAAGDGDLGPKTPFDDLMGGLKPQSTGFMPPTSFGMPLQGQVTGNAAGFLNPQRTGLMPQTSFGMPMQPTGGAQLNPVGNTGVGTQPTGFMPQTSFDAPLQSQLTGGAIQRQPTGGLQNNFGSNLQPQVTGGFPALQPQKIQPQATGNLFSQGTGGLRPQLTGSFQQQPQQQQLSGFQPQPSGFFPSQPTGGFESQPTGGFQSQLAGGLKPQGTGGLQQQGFGGGIQPQTTGGFQQPTSTGGFQQPQSTGGFQQFQSSGTFQQPQSTGGFQQPQSSGSFQQPQFTGGFQHSQSNNGLQPQVTGLQPQSTGPLQPQGTGSLGQQGGGIPPLQPQGTGSINSNLPQRSNGGFQGVPPQQQPQFTGAIMPQATGSGSTAVPFQQTGLSSQSTGFLPPSGFNPTQPLSAQKTGLGNNEIYTQSTFGQDFNSENVDEILPEEKSLFYKIFQTYDTDKRGILDASKAVEIFRKSGLNRSDLEHIWALCDINNTGQLNKQEFSLGMHLVYRKLNGFQLPNRLPLNLIPSSTKILDNVKNQIKSSTGTEDRRSSTKTDALSYKNNDEEDVLPSFRNRRKVFGANASSGNATQDASVPVSSTSVTSQQVKPSASDLKRAIHEKRQHLDTEKVRLQASSSDDDLRFISSLKTQISELPPISVVNDSVPADLKNRYETLLVKLPSLFVQIDEIDTQIRNSKLQLFKMKNPFSISGSGPSGEVTDEDRKKAKSKALLKSRMNALTGRSSGTVGSFEEEEAKYNEEVQKINASCDSNKEIIGDVKSSIADIAASLESGLSGGGVRSNPSDFERWEFGTHLEPEVREFVYNLRTKSSQQKQKNSKTVDTDVSNSQQTYSQQTANGAPKQVHGNEAQFGSNGYPEQLAHNDSQPMASSNNQSSSYMDPSGNYRSQTAGNSYSYSSGGNPSNNPNGELGDRKASYTGGNSPNHSPVNEGIDADDGEDEEEKQLRKKLEMLKLKRKSEKEKRLADLRRQIEEAKADGDEEAEVAALQNVANQSSTSSMSVSQVPAPNATPSTMYQGGGAYPNVNSSRPSYGNAPMTHTGMNSVHSSMGISSPGSSMVSPQPSGQNGRNSFFKQTPSTSSSFDLKAAEMQRRLQRGLDDDESEGWSDDENDNSHTAPPQNSTDPYSQVPSSQVSTPVAPAPVAPVPVVSSEKDPKSATPYTPQVKDQGPPIPVAPPLPQMQQDEPAVPIAPPLPQIQSDNKSFFPGPPPLVPNEEENSNYTHGREVTEGHYAGEDYDDDNDSLSIPESVGSDDDNFQMAPSAPSNIPPPPPLP